jgi:hypothetical protein
MAKLIQAKRHRKGLISFPVGVAANKIEGYNL